MKKVLFVDDEILIRETVRDCIPWEKEGFLYVGDASDGEVALPLIEQLKPDILITDIKMPFMNGIELSTLVRKRMPNIKIIILSGHGEFEYARKALHIGVEEYSLKPISASHLIQTLHQVSDKIDKERREREQMEQLKHRTGEGSLERLWNDLCSGFLSSSEAIDTAEALSISLISPFYAVAILETRSPDALSPFPMERSDLLTTEISSLYKDLAIDPEEVWEFKHSRTKTVWILKGNTYEVLDRRLDAFRKRQEMTGERNQNGTLAMRIGIGSIQDRLSGIHLSFLDAEEDMHWQRLSEQNRLKLWEITRNSMNRQLFLDRQALIRFLKVGSPSETKTFIPEYMAGLKQIDWSSTLIGNYILYDITLEVFRTADELYQASDTSEKRLQDYQKSIEAIRSWEDACIYLITLTEQFWLWRSASSHRYTNLIMQVKEYIALHYDKNQTSLQEAAEYVNVSASHLSKIFSQETGQTFIEYLTQIRMERAMELLQSTQAKTYEIAFQIGYSDPHYFSNLFKRVTGMTTTEFRKKGLPDPQRGAQ